MPTDPTTDGYPIQPGGSVLEADREPKPRPPEAYHPGTGSDRYVRFLRDWCDVVLTPGQERILVAVEQNKYVHVEGANGFGKSYAVAGLALAFLYCNPHSTVNATSGGYATLDDTLWKPIKTMFKAGEEKGLPGRTLDNPPILRTELHDEWYFRAIAPRDPRDLEGRHNDHMLSIVEEADKPYITEEHVDSADSTITDSRDRMVVLGNPPEDEANVVWDLDQSDLWHTERFSSFDSHNVHVDLGLADGPKIPGLIELSKIKETWCEWTGDDWPADDDREAVAQLIRWSVDSEHEEFREDLPTRWYRRRAGVMPPAGAAAHRPITAEAARSACSRRMRETARQSFGIGIDVARKGGDSMAVVVIHDDKTTVEMWADQDHEVNYRNIIDVIDGLGRDSDTRRTPIAIDSSGEGSGLADRLANDPYLDNPVHRFDGSGQADDDTAYYNKRAEALARGGDWLSDVAVDDTRLSKELHACAREIQYEERSIKNNTVFKASPKDDLKDRLGQSPDALDAYCMGAWIAERQRNLGSGTWTGSVSTGRTDAWN